MSDEKPVPETLETIAEKITALGKSMDARFAQVDAHFAQVDARFAQVDGRFAEMDGRFAQVDGRFGQVDGRFGKIDQKFDELKAQLGVKIEAVEAQVMRVYDAVIAQQQHNKDNQAAHAVFTERIENHDLRILALESPQPPGA